MENKHNSGPWKITYTDQMGYRVSDSTGWGVAVVLKDVNDKADAQLIAAAPQMLEALEMAKLFIENGIEMGYISEPQPGTPESATLSAIRAAIAAVKGEI